MLINKETLEYLGELARIEVKGEKEEKLLKDLEKILNHFEELKTLNTELVEPMAGNTKEVNVFREDMDVSSRLLREKAVKAFPEEEKGFLKIPPVFE